MSSYTPFEQEILVAIKSLDQKVSSLDQKVSSLDQKVSVLDRRIDKLETTTQEFREEFRQENENNRALFQQTFSHISDMMSNHTDSYVSYTR
jgi:predicted RNase H-like nuclease (RuvC/YqgF family)